MSTSPCFFMTCLSWFVHWLHSMYSRYKCNRWSFTCFQWNIFARLISPMASRWFEVGWFCAGFSLAPRFRISGSPPMLSCCGLIHEEKVLPVHLVQHVIASPYCYYPSHGKYVSLVSLDHVTDSLLFLWKSRSFPPVLLRFPEQSWS